MMKRFSGLGLGFILGAAIIFGYSTIESNYQRLQALEHIAEPPIKEVKIDKAFQDDKYLYIRFAYKKNKECKPIRSEIKYSLGSDDFESFKIVKPFDETKEPLAVQPVIPDIWQKGYWTKYFPLVPKDKTMTIYTYVEHQCPDKNNPGSYFRIERSYGPFTITNPPFGDPDNS